MAITSRTYVAVNLSASGVLTPLYTVPTGVTSRLQLVSFAGYGGAGTYYDVTFWVTTPSGVIVQLASAPYLPPRAALQWQGILNLEAGYYVQLYIGNTEGTANYGVLITGEDLTAPP